MDEHSFTQLCTDAEQALADYRLYDALACLQGLLHNTSEPHLLGEHESLKSDYERMLQFMGEGGTDPQRDDVHLNLMRRAYALLDNAIRTYRLQSSSKSCATAYQALLANRQTDLEQLAAQVDRLCDTLAEERNRRDYNGRTARIRELEAATASAFTSLFNGLWTYKTVNRDEENLIQALVERQEDRQQPLLISALTLNLWECFDAGKYRILLHFCLSSNTEVRTRALTGVVWTYMKYKERFYLYPDLLKGLSILGQEPAVTADLLLLQKQLYMSLETDRAKKKLQEEILPDLMRSKRHRRNHMGFEELDIELTQALKGTPKEDWKLSKEDIKLANNMKAFMQMGEEGVDVNLATFSALKGFPFFRTTGNWFLPFDSRHPDVRGLFYTDDDKPLSFPHFLLQSGNFCDSDKYSLCLMLQNIPQSQRTAVMAKFGAQQDAEGKEDLLNGLMQQAETPTRRYRAYIENLYRFFKLSPHHNEFADPFKMGLLFTDYEALDQLVHTLEFLKEMAGFLMKLEYYDDAIAYWEEIKSTEGATADLLQKLAYCYQKKQLTGQAVTTYQQADLLEPDNEWTLYQLHLCYAALKHFDRELECLLKLEEMNPADARRIADTGFCLIRMERFEEAANRFYKLEYMGERVPTAMRAIAWCAFKTNKLEQAEKYYNKLLENNEKAKWEDFLNAGHIAWLQGNLKQAVALYRKYIERYRLQFPDKKDWLQPFNDDADELKAHGLSHTDICLVRDLIQPYTH